MIKQAAIVFLALVCFTPFVLGQNDGRFDVAVSAVGLLPKQTSGSGTTQIPTKNVGVLASVRLHLSPKNALEVNWAHGHDSQNYITSSLQYRVLTTLNEFTGAYVFSPIETPRFRPFLLAGGGVLVLNPDSTLVSGTPQSREGVRQTKPAFLYGGGVDYHVISFLTLRLQYRGLFYSPPDFKLPGLFTGGHGHMAEPSVGIVIRF